MKAFYLKGRLKKRMEGFFPLREILTGWTFPGSFEGVKHIFSL